MKIDLIYFLGALLAMLTLQVNGEFYNYTTNICCNGIITKRSSDSMGCCGNGTYDYVQQVCCGSAAYNNTLGFVCCGNRYIQSKGNQICCGNNLVDVSGYSYSCCGNTVFNYTDSLSCCVDKTFNTTTQVCCYDSGAVLDKPPAACPETSYYSCCGKKLLAPGQTCCNGVPINPSTTLVTYSDGYSYNATANCCPNGGIIQNPTTEVCCQNGVALPGDGSTSGCCGSTLYNYNTQYCCGTKIYSNSDYGFGCCGSELYEYATQSCCKGAVSNQTSLSCCM